LRDVRLVADVILPHAVNEVRVEGKAPFLVWRGTCAGSGSNLTIPRLTRMSFKPAGGRHDRGRTREPVYQHFAEFVGSGYRLPIRSSRALKIYVSNVATQPGETDGYTSGIMCRVIEEHVGSGFFDWW